ncbi:MAG: carboxypeptidase regulatory-like domain-containing protein [candidate division Zixibacteria bacterium]|nr:carboxypeptidase regulatory-like domain-containing protein [candidate division Zixibacteria bacterium]
MHSKPFSVYMVLWLAVLFADPGVIAGDFGTLTGKITDAVSGDGVAGAAVQAVGTQQGAMSTGDGSFVVKNLPVGTYSLRISSIGHASLDTSGIVITVGAVTRLDVSLERRVSDLSGDPVVRGVRDIGPAYTRFGIKLFQEILRTDFGSNVFISPASAAIALAMVYNGADGLTKDEMQQALQLQGFTLEDVNAANAVLKTALAADPTVVLSVANSIWMRHDFDFREDFLERTRLYYDAAVERLDFADPEAPKIINAWVAENTNQRIKKIIGAISRRDIMFLINALYFKGMWTHPFDTNHTHEGDFTLLDGNRKKHPLMQQTGRFGYFATETFQAISLPYGNGRSSMLVVLPGAENGLEQFQKDLTAENWEQWRLALRPGMEQEGTIVLPRFKLEYERTLNDALIAMGMKAAFHPAAADFRGMWMPKPDSNIFISLVKQKTFLEVNEEGTEAAAVTVVGMALADAVMDTPPPFEMIVDRPFFCAIVDNKSGLPLFMGSIVDPQ